MSTAYNPSIDWDSAYEYVFGHLKKPKKPKKPVLVPADDAYPGDDVIYVKGKQQTGCEVIYAGASYASVKINGDIVMVRKEDLYVWKIQ